MTPELFVQALVRVILEGTVPGFLRGIEYPPGRRPAEWLADLSNWYGGLNEDDRSAAAEFARRAAIAATRSVLAVLDGSLAFEDRGEEGVLKLTYVKDGDEILLNDPGSLALDAEFGRLTG